MSKDMCEYCKEEIEIYACIDINGSSELCCEECHNNLYQDIKNTEEFLNHEVNKGVVK